MELVITLLISSVVVSTAYYGYSLIRRQFDKTRARANAIDRFHLLAGVMQKDFDRSISVRRGADGQLLCQWTDTLISYAFLPAEMVRELPGGVRDSFDLKATIKDIHYFSDSLPLIEGVRMEVEVSGDTILLPLQKMYSSKEILLAERRQDENTPE